MKYTLSFILSLTFLCSAAQSYDCYNECRKQGIELFYQNKFDSAKVKFNAARYGCDPIPADNDIDEWIEKALMGWINSMRAQKNITDSLRNVAEKEKIDASLLNLDFAYNLALQSKLVNNDPKFAGLLALEAFTINKTFGGPAEVQIIYDALRNAYNKLTHNQFEFSTNKLARALYKDSHYLMFADLDGTLFRKNLEYDDIYQTRINKSKVPVSTLFFSPKGDWLIAGYDNNAIYAYHLSDSALTELNGHNGLLRAVAFSPDGSCFATSGRDSTMILWHITGEKIIKLNAIHSTSQVKALIYLYGNDTLVSAQADGKLLLWDLKKCESILLLNTSGVIPLSLAFNRPGNILLAGYSDGSIQKFDLMSRKDLKHPNPVKYPGHTAGIDFIIFNKDYKWVATAGSDKIIKIYDFAGYFEDSSLVSNPVEIKYPNAKIRSIVFSEDNRIIAGFTDNKIRLEEISSEKLSEKLCKLITKEFTDTQKKKYFGKKFQYQEPCVHSKLNKR